LLPLAPESLIRSPLLCLESRLGVQSVVKHKVAGSDDGLWGLLFAIAGHGARQREWQRSSLALARAGAGGQWGQAELLLERLLREIADALKLVLLLAAEHFNFSVEEKE